MGNMFNVILTKYLTLGQEIGTELCVLGFSWYEKYVEGCLNYVFDIDSKSTLKSAHGI